jgi:hypothetical protein
VTCDAQGKTPTMHLQLANKSDRPTGVVVGFTPPNTQTHIVNSVSVFAIRPATGASEEYVYVNPKYALAKGAAWIVSLAPGATHDLDLPLVDFISGLNYSSLDPMIVGGTRLVLDARRATGQSAAVWTGKIETVLEPCHL